MAVWETRPSDMFDRPVLLAVDEQDVRDRMFVTDGHAKDWAYRPTMALASRASSNSSCRRGPNDAGAAGHSDRNAPGCDCDQRRLAD